MKGFRLSGLWSWPMRTTSEPLAEALAAGEPRRERRKARLGLGSSPPGGAGADRHDRDDRREQRTETDQA